MHWKVLKLNASYVPIDVIHWTEAITDIFGGKCEIVDVYEGEFLHYGFDYETNGPKGQMPVPAVIRTTRFHSPKGTLRFYKPFIRRNVWERDGRHCQYCGRRISLNEMEYEHVHPRSKGGATCWTNIVSSCHDCNSKKGDKSCAESNMHPLTKPIAPVIADGYIGGMLDRVRGKIGNIEKLDNHVWGNYIHMIKGVKAS